LLMHARPYKAWIASRFHAPTWNKQTPRECRSRKSLVLFVWKMCCLKVYWKVLGSNLASYFVSRDVIGISFWDCLSLSTDPTDQRRVWGVIWHRS
jgi:hypothetical protein